MQFTTSILAFVAAAVSAVSAQSSTAGYDQKYDDGSFPSFNLACSDGANGMITKGYSTIGAIPSFPNVGGAPVIPGWNSPNCGTCWAITYQGKTINVVAVDHADSWVLSLSALNTLTNGQGTALGRVPVTYAQVANSACGLP